VHSGEHIFLSGAPIIEFDERCAQILGWKGASLEAKDVRDVNLDSRRSVKEKNLRL
jgi:hypothetical protein